jgi:hypothetical protein
MKGYVAAPAQGQIAGLVLRAYLGRVCSQGCDRNLFVSHDSPQLYSSVSMRANISSKEPRRQHHHHHRNPRSSCTSIEIVDETGVTVRLNQCKGPSYPPGYFVFVLGSGYGRPQLLVVGPKNNSERKQGPLHLKRTGDSSATYSLRMS